MFVPCIVWLSIIHQHYALIITPLFNTQAPTCFGIHRPSSGRFLCPYELVEWQKWLCCSHFLLVVAFNSNFDGIWMPKHVRAYVINNGVIISA
jgi:hypothetical protein